MLTKSIMPPKESGASYNIFISYAHARGNFARYVYKMLVEKGYKVWIDLDGILLTEEWWPSIQEGIVESSYILLISNPDWFASDVSNRELAYALKQNKSFIDIRYRRVQPKEIEGIKQKRLLEGKSAEGNTLINEHFALLNERQHWAYHDGVTTKLAIISGVNSDEVEALLDVAEDKVFGGSQGKRRFAPQIEEAAQAIVAEVFERGLNQIIQTIENPPAHQAMHTRLLTRANEWEAKERNSSLLLRGKDLSEAQTWLSEAAGKKDNRPNELQQKYITASQQAQTRFRTFLSVIAAIAAIIAGLLFVRANYEADRANHNEAIAVEQRNSALNTAVTLAMNQKAVHIPVGGLPNTPLLVGTDLWVTSREDGKLWRLAADTGEARTGAVQVGTRPSRPISDGQFIWVSNSGDDTITRIDPSGQQPMMTIKVGKYPEQALIASNHLWVLTQDGLSEVEPKSGVVVQTVEVGKGAQFPVFDGSFVWVLSKEDDQLTAVKVADGTVTTLKTEFNPYDLIASGSSLWLTYNDRVELWPIDSAKMTFGTKVDLPSKPLHSTADKNWLWLAGADGVVLQIDPANGKLVNSIPTGSAVDGLFPIEGRLWIQTVAGQLIAYDLTSQKITSMTPLQGSFESPVSDGEHLWFTNRQQNSILMVNLADGKLVRNLSGCEKPGTPFFDDVNMWIPCQGSADILRIPALLAYYQPDDFTSSTRPLTPVYDGENLWITQEQSEKIVHLDGRTGLELGTYDIGSEPRQPIFDKPYIWVAATDQLTRFDPSDLDHPLHIPISGSMATVMVIGQQVWVTAVNSLNKTHDPDLWIIDRETGKIIRQDDLGMGITGLTYNAQANRVWFSSTTPLGIGTVYAVDANNGDVIWQTQAGVASWPPLLIGDSLWMVSLYNEDLVKTATTLSPEFTKDVPGTLYQIRQSDGQVLNTMPLGALPSAPVSAGGYLWITQVSLGGLLGNNPYGLVAIDPHKLSIAKTWNPCTSLNAPTYAPPYLWAVCLGLDDKVGTVLVIDPEKLEVVHEYSDLGLGSWPAEPIGSSIWIVHQTTGNASVFNSADGLLIHRYGLGISPSKPVFDKKMVWIANNGDGSIQRIRCSICG